MSRRTATLAPDYFDGLYARDPDPWAFQSSPYERDKYADTLRLLDRPPYRSALEVGCSIGVFTRSLAPLCTQLTAIDPSERALDQARRACAAFDNVVFRQGMMPGDLPDGPFDLILLSEVLYYLDSADAEAAARLCCDRLAGGGRAVLCHWLGETDYPLTGDEAADLFVRVAGEKGLHAETWRRAEYRLDRIAAPG